MCLFCSLVPALSVSDVGMGWVEGGDQINCGACAVAGYAVCHLGLNRLDRKKDSM